jgi:3-oxoacyl-[acyl-carrier-protein] synthase-3
MVDTTDAWIVERTGIRERRIAGKGETTFSLGLAAATGALEVAKLEGGDVDLVIVATLTPEFGVPATASLIQEAIGASSAGAFDINAACAGFVYAMSVAKGLIESGAHRNVLIVGSDTMSRIVDWTDRSTCVLFGDGAGAVVMQATDGPGGILSTVLGSDGAGAPLLIQPAGGSHQPATVETIKSGAHYLQMNGREVYKFAVKATAEAARRTMYETGLGPDDVDLFIPHQANLRIIKSAARGAGIPMDRVFVNADRYGNTSAGSIPIALCEALEAGRIQAGDLVLMVGFGAGLAWAAAAMEWTAATVGLEAVATAAASAG